MGESVPRYPECLPDSQARRVLRRSLRAMQLRDVEPELRGYRFDRLRRLIYKHADPPDVRGHAVDPVRQQTQRSRAGGFLGKR